MSLSKRTIGKIMFFSFLFVFILVLFCCCQRPVPINVKRGIQDLNKCDHYEVISNMYARSDTIFRGEVEMRALDQKLKKGWGRYKIRYFETRRLHGKYTGYAVIYYWKKK